ncbi:MAG: hypothetical protein QM751_12940 [Paludibacteraceae bacterium]
MDTLIVGGTGVVAQVVAEAIDLKSPEYIDYGYIAAGALLPAFVKGSPTVEKMSDGLLAVGAYRLAERYDIAGKLGFNTAAAATSGIDFNNGTIGAQGWKPTPVFRAQANQEKKNSTVQ